MPKPCRDSPCKVAPFFNISYKQKMKALKSRRTEALKASILRLFCLQEGNQLCSSILEETNKLPFTIPSSSKQWKNLLLPSDLADPL